MEKIIKNLHTNKREKNYPENSEDLAEEIGNLALEKKAEDILVFDLKELTTMTDYFVICSGSSDKHVKAITDTITSNIKNDFKIRPWHVEGYSFLRWVLIDYVDVVVHVFLKEVRENYNLERLWGDAKIKEIKDKDIP